MAFLPYYLLIGAVVGFVVILYVGQLRLVSRVLLFLGKVAIIALLILLLGWFVGLWKLPPLVANLFITLDRLWEPFHEAFMAWLRGYLR